MRNGLKFELQITPDSSIPNRTEITFFTSYLWLTSATINPTSGS